MQRFGLDVLRHVAGGSAACAEACAEAGAATAIVAAIRAHPDEGLQAKGCAALLAVAAGSAACNQVVTAAGGEAAAAESAAANPTHAVIQRCAADLVALRARASLAADVAMEALLLEEAAEKGGSGSGGRQSKASRKRESQRLRKAAAAHERELPALVEAAVDGAQMEAPAEEVRAAAAELRVLGDPEPTEHTETAQVAEMPTVTAPTAAALGLPSMVDDTSTLGGGTTCSICFMGTKSHVAVPCGHQFACGDCAGVLMKKGELCPMCRGVISVFIQVHVC